MHLPFVTDDEIQAVANLSKSEREDLTRRINAAEPLTIFTPAQKQPANSDKRFIICPNCGNGSGSDNTPVDVNFKNGKWLYHCFAQADLEGDLISIIAAHDNLNPKTDFFKILAIGANLINQSIYSSPADTKQKKFVMQKKRETEPSELPLIQADIKDAQNHLDELPVPDRRGLSLQTLKHFGCGYIEKWLHPKIRKERKFTYYTRRLIIPTDDKAHYLAALPVNERDNSPVRYWKMHAGAKSQPFNQSAIFRADLIIIVEGEIDAMSVWQASDGKVAVIATLSASDKEILTDILDQRQITDKKFLILFDGDSTGRLDAEKLRLELSKRNIPAVSKFLFDALDESDKKSFNAKVDANELLTSRGDQFLLSLIEKIIDDAQTDFDAVEEKIASEKLFDDLISAWRKSRKNEPVAPDVISDLKAAKDFIDALTKETFTASIAFDLSKRRSVALCKFYMPPLAQKFFAVMKDAQKTAADKIKDLKPPAEIPAELKALAALRPSEFEDAVDEFVTHIKREQKLYLKNVTALNEKKQFEAKKKAFLKNRPSTKKIISDCPIDLVLPESVFFSEHGIGTQAFTKNGDVSTQSAAKTPCVPTKIFREPDKHITQYEVAVKAKRKWRSVIVDGEELADTKKILRLATDGGALIDDPRAFTHFFTDLIALNQDLLQEIKCFQKTGWHGDNFIYPTGGDDYIVRRAGFNYADEFATRGDPELWKKTFLDAYDKGGALVCIFAGTALAAPLIEPLNLPNLQTHLYGEPNCGKSALEKLTASVYGKPSELIRTFSSTLKNRQAVAAAFSDLPTFLDELGTLQGGKKAEESLPQMIYDFFEGKANQANKRNGSVRETFKFRGSRVSSAERALLKSHDAQGAYKRLLQLICKEKIFEDSFASDLYFITEHHFGHFGKKWIVFVTEHRQEILDKYLEFNRLFASFPQKKNLEPTLLKTVVASALGFHYFLVCIDAKKSFDDHLFCRDINAVISQLPTLHELDESTRALADLQSFVAGHQKFFAFDIKDHSADGYTNINSSSFECYGKIFDNGEVAFFPTALKKILEGELGFASMDTLIEKWARQNLIRCTKGKGYRFSTRIGNKSLGTYRFKSGAILNIEEDEDELIEEST